MIFDYDVYRDELRALGFGLPLYEPGPSGYDRVRIGDVGLVTRYGFFQRIFNIFHDADHPINAEFGVPADFEPVTDSKYKKEANLADIAPESRLKSEHVTSIDISTSASLQGSLTALIESGASVRFKSSKSSAAALFLPNGANASVAVRTGWFREYAKKHCRSWCDHARANDLDLQHQGIMLVTGHHLTDRWATAVVRGSEIQSDTSVGFTTPFVGASMSVRRTQARELQAPLRIGPNRVMEHTEDADQVDLPCADTRAFAGAVDPRRKERDQCVFLRGFHVVERRVGPIKIKAAAEVKDPRPDSDSDFDVMSIESDVDASQDLFDSLLENVTNEFFKTSTSDICLVDEDILYPMAGDARKKNTGVEQERTERRAFTHPEDAKADLEAQTSYHNTCAMQHSEVEGCMRDIHAERDRVSEVGREEGTSIIIADPWSTIDPFSTPSFLSQYPANYWYDQLFRMEKDGCPPFFTDPEAGLIEGGLGPLGPVKSLLGSIPTQTLAGNRHSVLWDIESDGMSYGSSSSSSSSSSSQTFSLAYTHTRKRRQSALGPLRLPDRCESSSSSHSSDRSIRYPTSELSEHRSKSATERKLP